jgi:hypothetical protein
MRLITQLEWRSSLCYTEDTMPPWIERDQPTPFDHSPITARRDLNGDKLALKYHQPWIEGKKYPVIHFPSGTEREIVPGRGNASDPHIHIFGSLELPYHSSRDEAFERALPFVQEQGLILSKEHEQGLRIANPQTHRSYALTFDNEVRCIRDIRLFPQYAMELMPGEIRAILPPLYSQEPKAMEAISSVKYFTPDANWTWYATEYDGKDLFFGLVSGYEVELGYFTLSELEEVRGGLNLPIERDLHYTPKTLQDIQDYERQLKR